MIIIVPKKVDGLKYIEKNLEMIPFDYVTDFERYSSEIFLTLPKFKIESKIDMVPIIEEVCY
jgi:serine protease inhibitor